MSRKGPNKVTVTKEELEQVYVNDAEATMSSVAEKYHVHRFTIERWLKHYGIPPKARGNRHRALDKRLTDKEWLLREMESKTQKQIALELGVYPAVVTYWAQKHGLANENKSLAIKRSLALKYPEGRFGDKAARWKGGRREKEGQYVKVYMPDHPRANQGTVFEHVLVMEKHLGRYLNPGEVVHHIDGNKSNNAIENLELKASNAENISGHFKDSYETAMLRKLLAEREQRIAELEAELERCR